MARSDYLLKVYKILSDTSKFKTINDNIHITILHVEDKINKFLSKLKKKLNSITVETYNSLFVSGSSPGVLYGLPKTHKPNVPIRPIFSAINTPSYKLAKFFVHLLSELTVNQFSVENSFTFVKELLGF